MASAPPRSKLLAAPSRRRSTTTERAISAAAMPIGRLISSTHRQVSSSVMIPPSSVPVAPPAPFIAPHRPIARWRSGPAANEEVRIASEQAAITAPPKPCRARAPMSTPWLGASPPASDASANRSRPVTNGRRPPTMSAMRPLSIRNPAKVMV